MIYIKFYCYLIQREITGKVEVRLQCLSTIEKQWQRRKPERKKLKVTGAGSDNRNQRGHLTKLKEVSLN